MTLEVIRETATHQYEHHQKVAIFGQIAEIVQPGDEAGPRTTVGEKVVLSWGTYGAGCEIVPSGRALFATPGTELFVNMSALPRPSWIDGLRTYDVEGQWRGTSIVFAPQFVSPRRRARGDTVQTEVMTPAEFMAMYQVLTPSGSPVTRAMQEFLQWAMENPQLARKYPACAMVQVAEANLHHRGGGNRDDPCQ
jgi:hypothetical protein